MNMCRLRFPQFSFFLWESWENLTLFLIIFQCSPNFNFPQFFIFKYSIDILIFNHRIYQKQSLCPIFYCLRQFVKKKTKTESLQNQFVCFFRLHEFISCDVWNVQTNLLDDCCFIHIFFLLKPTWWLNYSMEIFWMLLGRWEGCWAFLSINFF
jgi:hypothetical protein